MSTLHLFRIRVERPKQLHLMDSGEPAASLIGRAIEEQPSLATGRGHIWQIGNLQYVGPTGVYFKLGRISRSVLPVWDDDKHVFLDAEAPTAPYTHILLDLSYQVCGIAPKSSLGRSPASIGRRLQSVLNQSNLSLELGHKYIVKQILDPHDFITNIRNAYAVRQFSFTFSKPNFFDQNEFSRGLEDYLGHLDGRKGTIQVSGDDLDPELIERQTRAAVASGQEVKARIQRTRDARSKLIRVGSNPLEVAGDDLENEDERRGLLTRIIQKYEELRSRESA